MGTLSVPYPDAYAVEISDAVWGLFPPPEVPDGQQQITKGQNVVRMLRWQLKCAVMEARRRAAKAVSEAALVQVETDLG
jgi:hypothetical protein